MEHHAFLGSAVEMDPIHDGDVDQVVGGQAPILGRLQIVRGFVAAGPPAEVLNSPVFGS